MPKTPDATLRERATALGLHGLLARWHSVEAEPWLVPLITAEETERCRRSLERRIGHAALGIFKPVADFDWTHPRKIDRDAVEALFDLDFLREHINVVFIGSGGVGEHFLAHIVFENVARGAPTPEPRHVHLVYNLPVSAIKRGVYSLRIKLNSEGNLSAR